MNTLIVSLYVAEMLEKWTKLSGVVTIVAGIAVVVLLIAIVVVRDILEDCNAFTTSCAKYVKAALVITIIAGALYTIFPKKEVVYIAMGLKVGEFAVTEIANSDKFKKISEILDKELDNILTKYKEKAE